MKTTRTYFAHNPALRRVAIIALAAGFTCTAATAGEAQLSVANVSVTEGNSGTTQMNFSVVRSDDSSTNITVPYSVPPGTADPKKDYLRPANNSLLRIPAGFTQGIVSVQVIGDTKVEPDETLQLQLGQPAAYNLLPAFAETPAYPAGRSPHGSVAADFNADGVLDLAIADQEDDKVLVLIGDGSGRFGEAREFPAGKARAVTSADFNGDSMPDLAIPNYEANTVSILFGDGHGGFGARANYAAGVHPDAIATADFNGDGHPDVVVTNEGTSNAESNVSVFLGSSGGTLGSAMNFKVGYFPDAVAIADLNGDGVLDLAVVNRSGNSISILTGKGGGKFRAATNLDSGPAAAAIAIGDFNGDGRPDLAVANNAGIRILPGLGGGNFGTPVDIAAGAGSLSIAVADFSQDGKLDLAVAERSSYNIQVLVGDGGGGFAAGKTFRITKLPTSVTAADFNGDGHPDLAVTDSIGTSQANGVSILLGTGENDFAATESYVVGTFPDYMASADFNQDGFPDLAVANSFGDDISILLGTGNGVFASARRIGIERYPDSVATADFNGDGRPDLLVTTSGDAGTKILLLLGDGSGGFGAPVPLNLDDGAIYRHYAISADFNGDGLADIASTVNGGVAILLGNGRAGFGPPVKFTVDGFNGDLILVAADLNGDGRLDLVVPIFSHDNHALAVLLGNGSGGFGPPSTVNTGSRSSAAFALGDLNGDGIPDLAVERSGNQQYLAVLTGDGAGGFVGLRDLFLGRDGYPGGNLAIVDFNGDGKRDIALITRKKKAGQNEDTVSILANDGNGNFGLPATIAGGILSRLLAVDLNGDGKRDVAVSNGTNGTIEVFFNSPDSTAVLSNSSATGTIVNDD